jgi:hypothetical protein
MARFSEAPETAWCSQSLRLRCESHCKRAKVVRADAKALDAGGRPP